jgi:hypothetical protein
MSPPRHAINEGLTPELCDEKHRGVDHRFKGVGTGINRIYWFGSIAVAFISALLILSLNWAQSAATKATVVETSVQVQEAKNTGYRTTIDTKLVELSGQIAEVKVRVDKMATAEKQDEMLRELRGLRTGRETYPSAPAPAKAAE